MTELEKFRKEKDQFYAADPQSPLTPKQKKGFAGLNYFPENPALRLELPVEEYPDREEIEIQTSTGDIQVYTRYGKVHFSVEGQPVELTLYDNEGYLFLPFTDSLAGTETYGAGRYLEPQQAGEGSFLLDFNYAYNPYCAYNENWSCPITPRENRLKVPIRAGEKIFNTDHG
jgi:uncharacterized protein (DUF1684 family)